SIWYTAPCTPCTFMAQIPSTTKPRWLTDEYATSFFMSGCTIATSAPYTMPITARNARYGAKYDAASGNNGNAKRTSPYVPIFSSTPARMTEPAVGASTCASGSHVWKGNIGTLMANPTKKPRKIQIAAYGP